MNGYHQVAEEPLAARTSNNCGSIIASPTFEWGADNNSRDSFEPVPLFGLRSNSAENLLASASEGEPFVTTAAVDGVEPSSSSFNHQNSSGKRYTTDSLEIPLISRRKKKRKGLPKRALSAYNLYFQRERQKIMDAQEIDGKVSFEELGKMIGKRWKELSALDREEYDKLAAQDSIRYRNEMEAFNDEKKKRIAEIDKIEPSQEQPLPLAIGERPHSPPLPPPRHMMEARYMSSPPDSRGRTMFLPPMYGSTRDMAHPYPPSTAHEHFPPPPYPHMGPPSERHHHRNSSFSEPYAQHYYPPHSVRSGAIRPPSRAQSHPPAPVPSAMEFNDLYPIPPGMELMLRDCDGRERKYRVEYVAYTMTREAAKDYMDRFAATFSHHHPAPSLAHHADAPDNRMEQNTHSAAAAESAARSPTHWGRY